MSNKVGRPRKYEETIHWRAKDAENARRVLKVPRVDDPRWDATPGLAEQLIRIQRRRCWVLWAPTRPYKHSASGRILSLPRVGLVVKPIDRCDHIQAVIPCE